MLKLKIISRVILWLCLTTGIAKGQSWERTYEKLTRMWGMNAVESYDKGFLAGGNYNEFPLGALVKTDINGNLLWKKYSSDSLSVTAINTTSDKGILIGGYTTRIDSTGSASILKLDACGITQWGSILYFHNPAVYTFINRVLELSTGNILAVGVNFDPNRTVLFCLDRKGQFKWKFTNTGFIRNVIEINSNKIIVTGSVYTKDPGQDTSIRWLHGFIAELDSTGKMVWSDVYGRENKQLGTACGAFRTPDQGLLVFNVNQNNDHLKKGNMYVIKYSLQRQREWVKYFGDSALEESTDDGVAINDSTYLLMAVTSNDRYLNNSGLRLIKVNDKGNVLAQRDYPRTDYTEGHSIIRTSGGKYLVGGGGLVKGSITPYIFALKVNENLEEDSVYAHSSLQYDYGCATPITSDSIQFPDTFTLIHVDTMSFPSGIATRTKENTAFTLFPNPAGDMISILFSRDHTTAFTLRIINSMGITVRTQEVPASILSIRIPLDDMPPGLYSILSESGGRIIGVKKFIRR